MVEALAFVHGKQVIHRLVIDIRHHGAFFFIILAQFELIRAYLFIQLTNK